MFSLSRKNLVTPRLVLRITLYLCNSLLALLWNPINVRIAWRP